MFFGLIFKCIKHVILSLYYRAFYFPILENLLSYITFLYRNELQTGIFTYTEIIFNKYIL